VLLCGSVHVGARVWQLSEVLLPDHAFAFAMEVHLRQLLGS
jgi:hypothetical protein